MRIELHPAAEAEAREAFHYRAADPSVASRFMAALDSAIAEPSHSRPVTMSAKEHLDLSRGRNARLLARRISRSEIETGRAYVIHARNGGVGVAVEEDDVLGYRLHRVKFGQHYLFVEYDYEDDDTFGTAIPLAFISEKPPDDEAALLDWLREQELANQAAIGAAWSTILGADVSWVPES